MCIRDRPYPITLSSVTITNGATDVTSNYDITFAGGTLTVNKAAITITANDQTKTYGSTFTFTHDGTQVGVTSGALQNGDLITVDDAASAGAVATAAAGSYSVTLSSVTITNGATDVTSNYDITFANGTLTVNKAAITITANEQSKAYGAAFTFTHDGSQVSVTSGALQNGDLITVDDAASAGAAATAAAGPYPITLSSVTITNGATDVTSNYDITLANGTLSVTQAATST